MVIYQAYIQHIQNYHLEVSKQAPVYLFELPDSQETPCCSDKPGRRPLKPLTVLRTTTVHETF